ncbi:MAG: hypothetical protein IKN75_07165 [Prevotella sp.]|nr:hypothetical protein [Prevotella sp.]
MTNKNTKKQRRTAKQSKPEFTAKSRLYDLVKSEFHEELKNLCDVIKPYVSSDYEIDWKHLRYFDVLCEPRNKTELILLIAKFLLSIGKGSGLKCRMSVFIRYLASNEHSNFGLKSSSLNTLIYRQIAYLESAENNTEKL